jgi:hypothetical protein
MNWPGCPWRWHHKPRIRFEVKWRGKGLKYWLRIIQEQQSEAEDGLNYSLDCLLCDIAWELRKSRDEFFRDYTPDERAQLIATYRSQRHRDVVMMKFPVPRG